MQKMCSDTSSLSNAIVVILFQLFLHLKHGLVKVSTMRFYAIITRITASLWRFLYQWTEYLLHFQPTILHFFSSKENRITLEHSLELFVCYFFVIHFIFSKKEKRSMKNKLLPTFLKINSCFDFVWLRIFQVAKVFINSLNIQRFSKVFEHL